MRKTIFRNRMFIPAHYHYFGIKVALTWYNILWWKLMPGTIIKVKWPAGVTKLGKFPHVYYEESGDPNDHYRPWMEENVGSQGWDWDWSLVDTDIAHNRLTIKFRRGKEHHATMAMLRWA